MKRIGIVAHSAEGGALCFLTACREGQRVLGSHQHPEIVVSAIPLGLSMPAWHSGDHEAVARHLARGVEQVAASGADFYICPDNTAHAVLEDISAALPIPGLHIAEVVAHAMGTRGFKVAALLGTKWTMTGSVYPRALARRGLEVRRPDARWREMINRAILDELCIAQFLPETVDLFIEAIRLLGAKGSDCVILGCTEIPLIINANNSLLPVLDSTRLLATYAVRHAITPESEVRPNGWISLDAQSS